MSYITPAMIKVSNLVKRYSRQEEYHALLIQNFRTPEWEQNFRNSLDREIQLISQRSPNIDDLEVNLFQKALIILHDQGKKISASNLYAELILEITTVRSFTLHSKA